MKQINSEVEIEAIENMDNKFFYYPFSVEEIVQNKRINNKFADIELKLKLADKENKFLVEIKNRSVPQVVDNAIGQIKNLVAETPGNYFPAVLVPNLNNGLFEKLKKENVSGFDLNGNYFISTSDMAGIRLDIKSKHKESSPIKNVYSGIASTVGRFLLQERKFYKSVNDIYNSINSAGCKIALSTVSKVLTRLAEDQIIKKDKSGIVLIQPEKLLQSLKNNYKSPQPVKELKLRLPDNRDEAKIILDKYFGNDWMWSGESSADYHAVTTIPNQYTVYTRAYYNSEEILKYADDRFYNYVFCLLPADQGYLFLNSKKGYASIVQTYIELMMLGKREKEIGLEIEKRITGRENNHE
jgi:hypothetical protein